MGIFTWLEIHGSWSDEQIEDVIEEVGQEFNNDKNELFEYWESIRDGDPPVSQEEKDRVLAEMAYYSTFAESDVSSFVLGPYAR